MGARGLVKRKPPVNPRPQLPARRRRQGPLGVIALLRIGLADNHPERPAERQPAPGDGLEVERGPRAGRVTVQADAPGTVRGRGKSGRRDRAAHCVEHQGRTAPARQLAYLLRPAGGAVVDRAIGADRFEFQLLYGVKPELQRRLAHDGYRVRVYVPFGTHWAGYFYRRMTERRENAIFALRSMLEEPARAYVQRVLRG